MTPAESVLRMDTDLSLEDIEFLRTVREINENPDEYEGTEDGAVPATTTAIRKGSDLSSGEVKYRLERESTVEQEGYVEIHKAEYDPETRKFDPKSAELTEKGVAELDRIDSEMGEGVDSDAVKELEARLDRLESMELGDGVDGAAVSSELQSLRGSVEQLQSEVERVSSELAALQDSTWGAIDDEMQTELNRVVEASPAMVYAMNAVLSIDVTEVSENGSYDEDRLQEVQAAVLRELASAVDANVLGSRRSPSTTSAGTEQSTQSSESGSGSDRSRRDVEVTPPSTGEPESE